MPSDPAPSTAKRAPGNFVRQFAHAGASQPPPAGLILDMFGNPMPNADTCLHDLHGRELQPAEDPGANYTPLGPQTDYDTAMRRRAQHQANAYRGRQFSQAQVDEVRYRITLILARDCMRERRLAPCMYHLWWANPAEPDSYELRQGNPPARCDRPKFLRAVDLEIDLTGYIPRDVQELVRPNGLLDTMVQECIDESENPRVSSAQVLMETIRRMATVYAWKGGARR